MRKVRGGSGWGADGKCTLGPATRERADRAGEVLGYAPNAPSLRDAPSLWDALKDHLVPAAELVKRNEPSFCQGLQLRRRERG
jgi:hypothetical protein